LYFEHNYKLTPKFKEKIINGDYQFTQINYCLTEINLQLRITGCYNKITLKKCYYKVKHKMLYLELNYFLLVAFFIENIFTHYQYSKQKNRHNSTGFLSTKINIYTCRS